MPSKTLVSAIGNTPLVMIDGLFVKCEYLNPSGSLKARLARHLVEQAEKNGLLRPGDTIVEATSGNTGNALSLVAAAKGYKMVVVMPHGFSSERVQISKALGAEVRMVGHIDVSAAVEEAKRLGMQSGWYCPRQFENPWNIEEYQKELAPEILSQLPEGVELDAIVQGVGTGGSLIGLGSALRKRFPNLKVYAMEPYEAQTLAKGEFEEHLIEGINDGFIPKLFADNRSMVDGIIPVKGDEAIQMMRDIAKTTGHFVGPSSAANYLAAQELRKQHGFKNVLILFCDKGEKYLQRHFS